MKSSSATQQYFFQIQSLKNTSLTNFTACQVNEQSQFETLQSQTSEIQIFNIKQPDANATEFMSIQELFLMCDQIIEKHGQISSKQLKIKQMNQLSKENGQQQKRGCPQCTYHLQRQFEWIKEKEQSEKTIQKLQIQIKQLSRLLNSQNMSHLREKLKDKQQKLNLMSDLGSICINEQFSDTKFQKKAISIRNLDNSSILHTDSINSIQQDYPNQILFESMKVFGKKLQNLQCQNKYLKIQNRTLQKTKAEIQIMKKEVEKTKNQRDVFKRKLITLAQKNSFAKYKTDQQHHYNKNQISGLRQRGNTNKKQSLFELSLTDDPSTRQLDELNEKNGKNQRQRKCFLSPKN